MLGAEEATEHFRAVHVCENQRSGGSWGAVDTRSLLPLLRMAGMVDHVGSDRAPNYDAQFKVAPVQTDLQFAFEVPLASVLNSIAEFAIRIGCLAAM